MGGGGGNNLNPENGPISRRRRRQRSGFGLRYVFTWPAMTVRQSLTIVFAPWPSMHDPIVVLLNVADQIEADGLTEKWTKGKLKELQYVGLTVRKKQRCTLTCHFSS